MRFDEKVLIRNSKCFQKNYYCAVSSSGFGRALSLLHLLRGCPLSVCIFFVQSSKSKVKSKYQFFNPLFHRCFIFLPQITLNWKMCSSHHNASFFCQSWLFGFVSNIHFPCSLKNLVAWSFVEKTKLGILNSYWQKFLLKVIEAFKDIW